MRLRFRNKTKISKEIQKNRLETEANIRKFAFQTEEELFENLSATQAGLTQEEFAVRSGLGLRFVRELEQGKETVRLDKVNQALRMFGMQAVPGKLVDREE